uniref:Uncharacterized protein n=1 Tax=Triticum urartu TaxID=4572 RepID=A0A8R7PFE0_TRIUA
MACRALALRTLLLPDPLHHLSLRAAASAPAAPFPCRRRRRNFRCCSSSSGGGPGEQGQPPQEAVLEAISTEVAKSKGRVALTTNMVIGGTVTDDSSDEWLVLDQKCRISRFCSWYHEIVYLGKPDWLVTVLQSA